MASKDIIEALIGDVERLMKLHDGAMEEIAALRAKSDEQNAKIRTLQEQLKEAKAQVAKASLQEAISGGVANKAAARAQVNRLLREVDKCITMVSNRI
jgi:uncharacterized coiled-coil DUF342 family protein